MDFIGLIILSIMAIIVVCALIKMMSSGKDKIIESRNHIYSAIGLLVLIITLALTILFK